MVAIAAAVIIGYAAYFERSYFAFGGEAILEVICLAYAFSQIVIIVRGRRK